MQVAKRLFPGLHTLFACNFLINGPIWINAGMLMDINNQNDISFQFLQKLKIKCGCWRVLAL